MKRGIWFLCIAMASWGVVAQEGTINAVVTQDGNYGVNISSICQATNLDYSLFGTTEISSSNNNNVQISQVPRRVFAVCAANFDEGLMLGSGFQELGACTVDGRSLSSLKGIVGIDANENGGGDFFVFCTGYPAE